jgi:hypothetical protein
VKDPAEAKEKKLPEGSPLRLKGQFKSRTFPFTELVQVWLRGVQPLFGKGGSATPAESKETATRKF